MDFLDIASRYAQNRFDQATQPFTDPNAYVENRLGFGGETEEERRKRLERERAEAEKQRALIGNTEVQSQQVKTYADGSQEHITTQQMPAPVAPVAPVAPPMVEQPPVQQAPAEQMQPRAPIAQLHPDHQAAIDRVMPPAGFVAPPSVGPETTERLNTIRTTRLANNPNITAAPANTPPSVGPETQEQMVRGAQTNAPVAPTAMPKAAPMATPVSTQGPVDPNAPPAPAPAAPAPKFNVPPAQEQMGPSTQFMDRPAWELKSTAAKNSNDWESLFIDPNTPPDIRKYAARQFGKVADYEDQERKANKIVDGLDSTDIGKYLKQRKEDGSWVKAILLQRLGFQKAADDEMQLIRGENKLESIMLDGARYAVETGPKGGVAEAFDSTGKKVDAKTLANINANFVGMSNNKVFEKSYVGVDKEGNKVVYSKNQFGTFVDTNGAPKPASTRIAYELSEDPENTRNKRFAGAGGEVAGAAVEKGLVLPGGASTGGGQIKNNNPGNIRYGQMAKDAGATGKDANGFAIFPDDKTGFAAQEKLWSSPAYKDLSISQAISKWAPNTENKPAEYVRTIKQKTGLDMDREFKDLSPTEKQLLLRAQAELEHGVKLSGVKIPNLIEQEAASKKIGEATGEVGAKDVKNQSSADSAYELIKPINQAIKDSTGSSIGTKVDTLASAIGKSTKGAQAIAKLDVLSYSLVSNVPRFEGPQGVLDVQLYERAAGDLANSKKPIETRLAALDAIVTLMKKYDKAGNNDWSFGSKGITKAEYDKLPGGATYVDPNGVTRVKK